MAPLEAPILAIPGENNTHQQQQQQFQYTGQLQKKKAAEGSIEWYFDQTINFMGDHPGLGAFSLEYFSAGFI